MFGLEMTNLAPVGGIVDFPALAAFVSWFLVAALVGSALGILREATVTRSQRNLNSGRSVTSIKPIVQTTADQAHRAAA